MKGMFEMRASAIKGRRLLAMCCLTTIALVASACAATGTSPAPARTVTVTATPPTSSNPPRTTPPAPAGQSQCLTTDLRLTVGASNGAAGTIYYPLDLTNISGSACTMYGYPGVAFVSSPGGHQVGVPASRRDTPAPALITLAPGETAHSTLAVSNVLIGNNCLRHQVQVHWVQVYPPDQFSALYAPLSRLGCADPSLVTMGVTAVSSGP
jgi:uncharacterized protein DUF4232